VRYTVDHDFWGSLVMYSVAADMQSSGVREEYTLEHESKVRQNTALGWWVLKSVSKRTMIGIRKIGTKLSNSGQSEWNSDSLDSVRTL
jgi:hypothetical protein